jgi:hypothetical protein
VLLNGLCEQQVPRQGNEENDADNSLPYPGTKGAHLGDLMAAVNEPGDDHSKEIILSRIRGRLKLRSMANTWRRRANNRAMPALKPFIPRLLRTELMEMAKW